MIIILYHKIQLALNFWNVTLIRFNSLLCISMTSTFRRTKSYLNNPVTPLKNTFISLLYHLKPHYYYYGKFLHYSIFIFWNNLFIARKAFFGATYQYLFDKEQLMFKLTKQPWGSWPTRREKSSQPSQHLTTAFQANPFHWFLSPRISTDNFPSHFSTSNPTTPFDFLARRCTFLQKGIFKPLLLVFLWFSGLFLVTHRNYLHHPNTQRTINPILCIYNWLIPNARAVVEHTLRAPVLVR